ncbi:MAG: hypothetical protein V7K89_07810 [Nostoc sp.]|uniref:hypothetical protein n=1 Tax=Nostoc sp. TaxID=1180 RepID=UPI002FF7A533
MRHYGNRQRNCPQTADIVRSGVSCNGSPLPPSYDSYWDEITNGDRESAHVLEQDTDSSQLISSQRSEGRSGDYDRFGTAADGD